jgi:glycosyltransferase involved in cell wall biosynthesis
MAKLCLNMIVKNEAARIERCLNSVAPWIDCWIIADTGSSDNTPKIIQRFFRERNIPGQAVYFPFENWEQARNAAFDAAVDSAQVFDYLLLCDADMELVVTDKNFAANLTDLSYNVTQRGGGLSYGNRRLAKRTAKGRYRGVTHEYLDIACGHEPLPGIWFKDHCDGANRPDKLERDVRLLLEGIKKDPDCYRYWYYLGQTYSDLGSFELARDAFAKRMQYDGWDEEKWHARVRYAEMLQKLDDENGFVAESIRAFNMRPWRAEPLFELARFYRFKDGMQRAALMILEECMKIPYPAKDQLFVNDYIYHVGIKQEYAICAFYDPMRRVQGFNICNRLSLDAGAPEGVRDEARANLLYYLTPLQAFAPSFKSTELMLDMPKGYVRANPALTIWDDGIWSIIRGVNYTITDGGAYVIGETGECATAANPIDTRNFLVKLDWDLNITGHGEILKPRNWPAPLNTTITGFEDNRLFVWKNELWTTSTVCEMSQDRWAEMIIARIEPSENEHEFRYGDDWFKIEPKPKQHEKNWMPQVRGDDLRFVYRLGVFVDTKGNFQDNTGTGSIDASRLSGGSPLMPYKGGWLAIVHEARWFSQQDHRRYYTHRLVWLDERSLLSRTSAPFCFHDKGIEYSAGLALHPDGERLMIAYSRRDRSAHIAAITLKDLEGMLWNEKQP